MLAEGYRAEGEEAGNTLVKDSDSIFAISLPSAAVNLLSDCKTPAAQPDWHTLVGA